jgi:hypothetical protein
VTIFSYVLTQLRQATETFEFRLPLVNRTLSHWLDWKAGWTGWLEGRTGWLEGRGFNPCFQPRRSSPDSLPFGGMLVPVLQLISPVCKTGTSLYTGWKLREVNHVASPFYKVATCTNQRCSTTRACEPVYESGHGRSVSSDVSHTSNICSASGSIGGIQIYLIS